MPDTFTPEQISQILEEFFKVVGTRQYIGARYVPIFGRKDEESIEWDNTAPYEPLTIVLYQGNSYTSRQYVPVGVEITNQEFWAITGNYNAQVEMYRRETAAAREVADNALAAANDAQTDIDTLLPKADFSAENTVKKYIDDSVAVVQTDIDTLLPKADFSADNTVKKYIDENKTRVLAFDTVSDMKNADYLVSGMTCRTNGFYSANDDGAAYYIVSDSGTANELDIIALSNNLYGHLLVFDTMNVAQFGIVPTSSNLHDKFNYVFNTFDCAFYVPAGTYVLTESINIQKNGTKIEFAKNARLECNSNTTFGHILGVLNVNDHIGDENPIGVNNVQIIGGTFYTSQSTENAIGIGIGCKNITIDGCIVELAGLKGITAQYSYSNIKITNCRVIDCGSGITIEGTSAGGAYIKPSAIVENCTIDKFAKFGIAGLGCTNIIFKSNNVNATATMSDKSGGGIYINDTTNAIVADNVIISDTQGIVGTRCEIISIINNIISAGDRGFNISASNVIIDACTILESLVIGGIIRNDGAGATPKSAIISNTKMNAPSGANGIWLLGDIKCSASNNDISGGNYALTNQSTNDVVVMGGQYSGSTNGFGSTVPKMAACLNNGALYHVGLA